MLSFYVKFYFVLCLTIGIGLLSVLFPVYIQFSLYLEYCVIPLLPHTLHLFYAILGAILLVYIISYHLIPLFYYQVTFLSIGWSPLWLLC